MCDPVIAVRQVAEETFSVSSFMNHFKQKIIPIEKKEAVLNKYFEETYKLIVDIWYKKLHNIKRPVISMGMSGSFEEAIEEGATVVRIGRMLFDRNETEV